MLETNAGIGSGFNDSEYMRNGCQILNSAQAVYDSVDVVIKIREPTLHPITGIHEIDMEREDNDHSRWSKHVKRNGDNAESNKCWNKLVVG